jgi:hypothetical protein
MAIVHKFDVCKKPIDATRVTVVTSAPFSSFEFCKMHGAPILAALKKYKLVPAV